MSQKIHAKKITLFLIDGIPQGRQSCELSNWTGKALRIPKIMIKESTDRIELLNPGVYMLFGKSIEQPDKDMVYIGESEVLYERLKQHASTKEFWNEAVVIFSKDENLNKAHIKYLEYRMYELAKKSKRYIVDNSQEPTRSSISEADKAEMEEFLENIELLINTMGYKVFHELISEIEIQKSNIFHIKAARGAEAKGQPTQEGFVVFKNSIMSSETVPSMPQWIENIRSQLITEEIVKKDENENYIFVINHLFNSASSAAATVMGRSANGLKEWKSNSGVSLGESEN